MESKVAQTPIPQSLTSKLLEEAARPSSVPRRRDLVDGVAPLRSDPTTTTQEFEDPDELLERPDWNINVKPGTEPERDRPIDVD